MRAALAACSTPGAAPCRVLLAKSYASGPLRINSSDTELHITGTLSMLTRDRYPKTPADQRAYGDFITNAPGVQRLQPRQQLDRSSLIAVLQLDRRAGAGGSVHLEPASTQGAGART